MSRIASLAAQLMALQYLSLQILFTGYNDSFMNPRMVVKILLCSSSKCSGWCLNHKIIEISTIKLKKKQYSYGEMNGHESCGL